MMYYACISEFETPEEGNQFISRLISAGAKPQDYFKEESEPLTRPEVAGVAAVSEMDTTAHAMNWTYVGVCPNGFVVICDESDVFDGCVFLAGAELNRYLAGGSPYGCFLPSEFPEFNRAAATSLINGLARTRLIVIKFRLIKFGVPKKGVTELTAQFSLLGANMFIDLDFAYNHNTRELQIKYDFQSYCAVDSHLLFEALYTKAATRNGYWRNGVPVREQPNYPY
jgi:hypothetical protein